ncbi:hypothetical protein MAUB1S_01833 [Mycolicibacterium aubagnense]
MPGHRWHTLAVMTDVQTVRGPLPVDHIGATLMHEHVVILGDEIRQNFPDYPSPWDEEARVADAIDQLRQCKSRGIKTIVDPTVIGLGRYLPRIQRINEQVDINIIVATGIYTYNDVPFQFLHNGPGLLFDTPEPMVELFVRDIREGIGGTGVRAAFLKCAIERQGLTPGVERVMRAVGQAHVQTGVPITVHTDARSRSGLVAQRVFRGGGRRPDQGGHRTLRRQYGISTTCARSPTPGRTSAWTGSDSTSCCHSNSGSIPSRRWPSGATPRRWCWRTTHRVSSTGSHTRENWLRCRTGN